MLIPIVERAALNDDEDIAKKWARLLATSAERLDESYPPYVEILSSLSPAEAAAMDHFWKGVPASELKNPGRHAFTVNFSPTAAMFDEPQNRV